MEKNLPDRKGTRLERFDYNKHGAYFITICTEGRRRILSEIVCDNGTEGQFALNEIGCEPFVGGQSRTPVPTDKSIKNQSTVTKSTSDAIVGDGVLDVPPIKLLKYGEIADKYLRQLNDFYDNVSVERYVIMPNHIHLILFVENIESILNNLDTNASEALETPHSTRHNSTVSRFISTFKRFCNKEYGENIWQRSFYDHIIRNQRDYDEVTKYIYENPMRWKFDKFYRENSD